MQFIGASLTLIIASVLLLTIATAPLLGVSSPSSATPSLQAALRSTVVVTTNRSEGSGFLLGESGCIMTAAHVTGSSERANVTWQGAQIEVTRVAIDKKLDLAVFALPDIPYDSGLLLADVEQVQAGMDIYVIGTPLGHEGTVTKGIVSAPSRTRDGVELIQIDAAVNPGNSGGPIIDATGRVVGLTVEMIADAQSVNYGVSVAEIRQFLVETGFEITSSGQTRRAATSTSSEEAGVTSDQTATNTPGGAGWTQCWWLFLAGAATGALLASCGFLLPMMLRKRTCSRSNDDLRIVLTEQSATHGGSQEELASHEPGEPEDLAGVEITLEEPGDASPQRHEAI